MNRETLIRECHVYTRYLAGMTPSPYIVEKYLDFHARHPGKTAPDSRFDGILLAVSRWHPWTAALADTYASRLARASALRRRLVVTLALLECAPPSFGHLDSPSANGAAATIAWGLLQSAGYAFRLSLALLLLGPVHGFTGGRPRGRQ